VLVRPKMGRVIISSPFIGGGPAQPNSFLAGHKQIGSKRARLTNFATPSCWGVGFSRQMTLNVGLSIFTILLGLNDIAGAKVIVHVYYGCRDILW